MALLSHYTECDGIHMMTETSLSNLILQRMSFNQTTSDRSKKEKVPIFIELSRLRFKEMSLYNSFGNFSIPPGLHLKNKGKERKRFLNKYSLYWVTSRNSFIFSLLFLKVNVLALSYSFFCVCLICFFENEDFFNCKY